MGGGPSSCDFDGFRVYTSFMEGCCKCAATRSVVCVPGGSRGDQGLQVAKIFSHLAKGCVGREANVTVLVDAHASRFGCRSAGTKKSPSLACVQVCVCACVRKVSGFVSHRGVEVLS